jgi:4-diphosphocytidyl-2-C-methyl-D-erythritol kinase
VPFFLRGGAALMQGRGDELHALPALVGQWLIVVVPKHTIENKTRQLYAALAPADFSDGARTGLAVTRLVQGLPLADSHFTNGFEPAARRVFPGLTETWSACEQACGRRFHLSGAGPALFALATDRRDAQHQHARLGELGLTAYSVRTVRYARAPSKLAAAPPIRYP